MAFNFPLGWGKKGHTHYGHESTTQVSVIPAAAHWAAGKPVPEKWAGKIQMNVPYHGLPK